MQGGSVFTQTQVPRLNGKMGFLGPIKVHSQFTSDAVEIWVHSDLPRGPRKKTVAELGVGPWSSLTSPDRGRPGGSVRCQERFGSLCREDVSPGAQRGAGKDLRAWP